MLQALPARYERALHERLPSTRPRSWKPPASTPRRAHDVLAGGPGGRRRRRAVRRALGESESFVWDDGRLKSASYDSTEGFGLRVVADETAGYAHAAEISEAAIRRAADSAALAKRGYAGEAAEGPRATNAKLYGEDDPLASPAFSDKVGLLDGDRRLRPRARPAREAGDASSWPASGGRSRSCAPTARLLRDVRPLVRARRLGHRRARRPARERLRSAPAAAPASRPGSRPTAGRSRWTRRCARRWSTWTPSPAPPARWTW